MDLSEVWQRHKSFIIPLGIALILLMFGQMIIGALWDADSVVRAQRRVLSKLNRTPYVKTSDIKNMERETRELRERLDSLAADLEHQPDSEFVLTTSERNPQIYYNDVLEVARRKLVFGPLRRNIHVVQDLGMPSFPSAERDEVAKTLLALSVVNQVVSYAVGSGVSGVEDITFKLKKKRRKQSKQKFVSELPIQFEIYGTGRAISNLVELLATEPWRGKDPFVSIAPGTTIKTTSEDGDRVEAKLSIVALDVDHDSES